jgi:hypothetical protein
VQAAAVQPTSGAAPADVPPAAQAPAANDASPSEPDYRQVPPYFFYIPPAELAKALAEARSTLGAESALSLLRRALPPILLRRDLILPLLEDNDARALLLATGVATLLRDAPHRSDFAGKSRPETGGSLPLPSLPSRLPHSPDAPASLGGSSGGAAPSLLICAFAILLAAFGLARPRRGWVVRSVTAGHHSLAFVSVSDRPG